MTNFKEDYSAIQLEYGALYGFLQAARRHMKSVEILHTHEDQSTVIFSRELLIYKSIEMSLKLIYILCDLLRNFDKLPIQAIDLHKYIDGKFRASGHNLDTLYNDILKIERPGIREKLSGLEFRYSEDQPAGNYYAITFNECAIQLNDSFSVRYPGYSRQGEPPISVFFADHEGVKIALSGHLLNICDNLFADLRKRVYEI